MTVHLEIHDIWIEKGSYYQWQIYMDEGAKGYLFIGLIMHL